MLLVAVELPWPDSALSANSRNRWAKIKAVTPARQMAKLTALNSRMHVIKPGIGDLIISMEFYPPTKRAFDLDGCITRCKAYQDGIFDALGIDDNLIVEINAKRCQVVKCGLVRIEVKTRYNK